MADAASRSTPLWVWPLALLAGAFLINAVPHGVMGVTGRAFPTVFSGGPPNLSSPELNVVWSAINVVLGLGLLYAIRLWTGSLAVRLVVAAGMFGFGVALARVFSGL